jgi:hypothetical protein
MIVIDTKILLTILCAFFDDSADRRRDWERIDKLSDVILRNDEGNDRLTRFASELWNRVISTLSDFSNV